MYSGTVNSPYTILSAGISDSATSITVEELGVFPAAPNIAVLGSGSDAETVLYSAKSAATGAGTLTVTRGWNKTGTYGAKKSWLAGTVISRRFTEYDHATFKANIEDHETYKAPLASPALTGTPTAPTAAAGTNTTQIATTAFVQAAFGQVDALIYKGTIACATNPNYPAADAGHVYKVSTAGKIGGASGLNVEVGDTLICCVDSSATGNQAAVGANWNILQVNIDGSVFTSDTPERGDVIYRGSSGYALLHHGTSGQYLKTNGDGADPSWADIVTVAALDDLTDVTITSAERGDVLYHNGTAWVNLHHGTDGQYLKTQGNGADPIWADLPAAGGSIPAPGSPEQGDILYYDGADWVLLHHGTSGQFLKTQGHGAAPIWADSTGGSGDEVIAWLGI